jgi:hypothetical protein
VVCDMSSGDFSLPLGACLDLGFLNITDEEFVNWMEE